MQTKERQNMYLPIIVFLLIGGIFVGTTIEPTPIAKQAIHPDCLEYDKEGVDNDGFTGMIDDPECHDYPYQDGNGEIETTFQNKMNNPPYQNYFDLSVDFTRFFIETQCSGILANCLGTNFETEVDFYCFFSENVMSENWGNIFDQFRQVLPDDGSFNTYINTCMVLGSLPNTMPNNGDQTSNPIPNNPGGDDYNKNLIR